MAETRRSSDQKKQNGNESSESADATPAEKPVSLHPLKFEEAVKGLLKTKQPKQNKNVGAEKEATDER